MKRFTAALLALALVLTALLSACAGNTDSAATTAVTTTAAAAGTSAAATAAATTAVTTAVTTAATAATTAATTTAVASVQPAQIRMFMSTSGITVPDGVDMNDNPYFNAIKQKAGVEVTELTVPPYADFGTKLQLLLSSGDIPDLVHGQGYYADINKIGADGAFIDMENVVRNSAQLSAQYTDEMLDMMRYSDEHVYALRSLPSDDVNCIGVRLDILNEINGGKIPATVEEWHDVLVKEKETYPDSVPVTGSGLYGDVDPFYRAFGVSVAGWQYSDGKYIHCFEAAHQKEALLYIKAQYDEGLLSPTFVTNTWQDYSNDKYNNRTMIQSNNLGSVLMWISRFANPELYTGADQVMLIPVPYPSSQFDDVDPIFAVQRKAPVGSHCIAISADSKEQDACVRMVEALLSDEVRTLTAWGIEGEDYTVENGKNVPTATSVDRSYRLLYAMMFTYWSTEHFEAVLPTYFSGVDPSVKDAYYAAVEDGMKSIYDRAAEVPATNPSDFVQITDEDMVIRINEATEEAYSIILKTIIGEMSLEDYDAAAAKFLEKYADVTQAYNDALAAVCEKYGF